MVKMPTVLFTEVQECRGNHRQVIKHMYWFHYVINGLLSMITVLHLLLVHKVNEYIMNSKMIMTDTNFSNSQYRANRVGISGNANNQAGNWSIQSQLQQGIMLYIKMHWYLMNNSMRFKDINHLLGFQHRAHSIIMTSYERHGVSNHKQLDCYSTVSSC